MSDTLIHLTRDQAAVLSSLARNGNCWICQPEMAALAALGLARHTDTCPITGRRKYEATPSLRAREASSRNPLTLS